MLTKYNALKNYLNSFESIAIAFSGGIDSAFLLRAAKDSIGDKVVAITANMYSFPERELKEAVKHCEKLGVKHIVLDIDELDIKNFSENLADRCYICKKEVFGKMLQTIKKNDISILAEGSNSDDIGDYRPGLKAIEELKILSPLKYIGFTKEEIRQTAKKLDISIWNKQSSACLSSRFAYGNKITKEKLKMVEDAEQLLYEIGFKQFRVRICDKSARIEVLPEEFEKIFKNREKIIEKFKDIGFIFISVDLEGYKIGNMNKTITKE